MKNAWIPTVFCCLAVLLLTATIHASPLLRVEGKRFVDHQGRTVVLRGFNVAGNSKVPPYRGVTAPEQLDNLQQWGVNAIRLLLNWEALEPTKGTYDPAYLEDYLTTITWAWQRDIFVIIDIHQDAYSRYNISGCGDGFPAWAVPTADNGADCQDAVTAHEPDNGPNCEGWGQDMLTDAEMHRSWHLFYEDKYGVRTRYLEMLQFVATRVAEHEIARQAVIGYDFMNEPWGGEETEILPLYEDASLVIRHADPTAILFVSPHAMRSSSISEGMHSFFGDIVDFFSPSTGFGEEMPRPSFDNFVYSPHYYDAVMIQFGSYDAKILGFISARRLFNVPAPDEAIAQMKQKADDWNVPVFIGEFGGGPAMGGIQRYLDRFYGAMDDHALSGTQWVYTPGWDPMAKDGWNAEDFSVIDDNGSARSHFRSRPFVKCITGPLTDSSVQLPDPFDEINGAAIFLQWQHDPAMGQTVIFAPHLDPSRPLEDQIEISLYGDANTTIELDGSARHLLIGDPDAGPKQIRIEYVDVTP